jgi:hypothetical protein
MRLSVNQLKRLIEAEVRDQMSDDDDVPGDVEIAQDDEGYLIPETSIIKRDRLDGFKKNLRQRRF